MFKNIEKEKMPSKLSNLYSSEGKYKMDLLKMPGVQYCEFKKGEYIIRQGEKLNYVFYIIKGACYRSILTNDGDEIIGGVKEPSNFAESILGLFNLYSDNKVNEHSFIAKRKCCCYRIPREVFFTYVDNKPEILKQIIYTATKTIRELSTTIRSRKYGKVANRLCELLLKKAKKVEDKILVDKAYGYTELGGLLGISKITVLRILKVLRDEGVIWKNKDGIYIRDKGKLLDYIDGKKNIKY